MAGITYKLYGERNCGTNLLRHLIADDRFLPDDAGLSRSRHINRLALQIGRRLPRCYDALYDLLTLDRHRDVLGWKHALPDPARLAHRGVVPVVIVKHPSFWLRSFLSRPFHHSPGSRRYLPRRIENMPPGDLRLEDLILAKYDAYRRAVEACDGVVVQYETLVSRFPEARRRLVTLFGHCEDLPARDVRPFVQPSDNDFAARHSNEALKALDAFDRETLQRHLSLLDFFGYDVDRWVPTLPFSR